MYGPQRLLRLHADQLDQTAVLFIIRCDPGRRLLRRHIPGFERVQLDVWTRERFFYLTIYPVDDGSWRTCRCKHADPCPELVAGYARFSDRRCRWKLSEPCIRRDGQETQTIRVDVRQNRRGTADQNLRFT